MHYYFDGFGLVWALLNFLFWAAVIGFAVWAVLRLTRSGPPTRYPVGPPPQAHHRESPREILDRRFASGEIDAAAYEDMRARIESTRPQQAQPAPAGSAAQTPQPGPAPQAAQPASDQAAQGESVQGQAEPPPGEEPTKQL